jgi:hypothetical protein
MPKAESKSDRHYTVIFRTCDAVTAVHGAPRPFGLDKTKLVQICFLSLKEALKPVNHTIHVMADKISPELSSFFKSFPVTITTGSWGNDESLRQSLSLALELPDEEWVYFCEDDYLHAPHAFVWIDDLIANRRDILSYSPRPPWMAFLSATLSGRPLVIHPPDYPDRYKPNRLIPSFLFLSKYCHWRQVTNTTFTVLAQAGAIRRYKRVWEKASSNAKDGLLSRRMYARFSFWKKALCLSPIPGVATHMHVSTMTPHVDWNGWVERFGDGIRNKTTRG